MHRLGQAGMAVHVVRSAITKQYRNDDPKKVCTPPSVHKTCVHALKSFQYSI